MKIIKTLILGVCCVIILFVFSTLICYADYHIIDLKELSIDYKNYAMVNKNARNSLIYPEPPKEAINVNINMDFATYFYWNNVIESLTTDGQYRSIGLQTQIGVRLSEHLELGYYHHSQHLIDRQHSYMDKYPVEDAVQIKLYLYKSNNRESIF